MMSRSASQSRLAASFWQTVNKKGSGLFSEKEKGVAGKGEALRKRIGLRLALLVGIALLVFLVGESHVFTSYSSKHDDGPDMVTGHNNMVYSGPANGDAKSRKLMHDKGTGQGTPTEPVEEQVKQQSIITLQKPEIKPTIDVDNKIRDVKAAAGKMETVVNKAPLDKMIEDAFAAGSLAKKEAEKEMADLAVRAKAWDHQTESLGDSLEPCQVSITQSGDDIRAAGGVVHLPCGLAIGSAFTLTGVVSKTDTEMRGTGFGFVLELQGLRIVEGEDPPRIFHLNPRLSGDWSGHAVVEHNTFYRSQWGAAQRCDGIPSKPEEEKVDGLPRCERWSRNDQAHLSSEKSSGWLQRLIHKTNQDAPEWPFPFRQNQMFVLTIRAGFEGFHVSVDGLHITSFPYRSGSMVEEATAVHIGGHFVAESFTGTSLPLNPPLKMPVLEQSASLKAPPLQEGEVDMFIGVLSASTHFDERLAVRKTWLQYPLVRSGAVPVRFFLGMHPSKLVNVEVHKEAELYGDMVILPFIDQYDLVVIKTVAICEWGIENTKAKYIMKADDDNFVRVQRVLENIKKVNRDRGLYMGNINEFHRPLRSGKWAVTEEEWPEKAYPPYANGPGYILSRDVAYFIYDMKARGYLRMFKMEDVSMGMWVMQYGINETVHYVHNWKFCQYGCTNDYITSHYQSPSQMMCLWKKLQRGDSGCCDEEKS